MAKEIKVLMMGAQRVGKSSALAAIVNSFRNAPINRYLTVEKITSDTGSAKVIEQHLKDIRRTLSKKYGKTILVDTCKTDDEKRYVLEIKVPSSNETLKIQFTDINGEFYEAGGMHHDLINKLVSENNVFIIAIDTPIMMEAANYDNDLVDDVVNEAYNRIDAIQTFISSINDKNGDKNKMVIFAPIKCEKWAREGRIREVTERVKESYRVVLNHLRPKSNVIIEICPIQTVGSIVFKEHLEANRFVYDKPMLKIFNVGLFNQRLDMRCSILPDGETVRLADGSTETMSEGKLVDDNESVLIPGTDIVRPNSWFEIVDRAYNPRNCEQIALHIFSFLLRDRIHEEILKDERKNFLERSFDVVGKTLESAVNFFTWGLWSAFREYFGNIPLGTMQKIIDNMRNDGIIKTNEEGIEIYKDIVMKELKKK